MKTSLIVTFLALITITAIAQNKPDRVKNFRSLAAGHETLVLLPFQFEKKEFKTLPEGVTEEMINEAEKDKGLKFQNYLHEMLAKKSHKYDHNWISPTEVNKKLEENGMSVDQLKVEDVNKIAELFGADAVIYSTVETPKLVLPDEKGGEMDWEGDRVYGISGNATYVNMSIHEAASSEPYWKWKIKFNGSFKRSELMIKIIEKNYIHDHFPYKY